MSLHLHRVSCLVAAMLLAAPCWAAAGPAAAGRGAQIAAKGSGGAVPACASCHGAHGEGSAAFPHLAGTGVDYLREQLEAFATGARKNPVMQPIAKGLTPQQRDEVAAYFASLGGGSNAGDKEARGPQDTGAWLATRGRWADNLPACSQCHGPGGIGVGSRFPPLAGQPAAYISAQLKAWQAGERPPGPLGLMQSVAGKLRGADVQAVSEYYASLGTQVKK
jgi:cytochrome c553